MTKCKDHHSFTHLFTRFTLIKEIRLHGRFTRFTTIKNRPGHSFTRPFTPLHAPQLHALLHVLLHAASRENKNPRSQLHASFTQELHAPPSPTEREGVRTRNTTPNSHPSRCRAHPVTGRRAHTRGDTPMPQQTDHDVDTSDDPNEPYPAAIGVFCDACGTEVVNDYIVSDALDREARFEIARAHLRREGWSCPPGSDLCPACKSEEASDADPA